MRRIRRALWCTGLLPAMLAGAAARAQSVTGFVRDSTGRPIAGAGVSIQSAGKTATSDDLGRYRLDGIAAGSRTIDVRRVGYAPLSRLEQIGPSATTIDFILSSLAVKLDTVRTSEDYRPTDLPMMEFLDNRRLGLGVFLSRDDLEKMNDRPLAEAFMQLHGLMVVTAHMTSSTAWLASAVNRAMPRDSVELEDHRCLALPRKGFGCAMWDQTSPNRDAWRTLCFPDIYMDFTLISRMDVPNINRFNTRQLEAIEVYTSPAQLPQRYISNRSACGVVVLHSLRPKK